MKKKLLSLALVLVTCFSLSVPALAVNETAEAKSMFRLKNNRVTSEDFKDGWTYKLKTPFVINGGGDDVSCPGYNAFSQDDSWTVSNTGSGCVVYVALLRYKADEKGGSHYTGPGTIYMWRDTDAFVDQAVEQDDRHGRELAIKPGDSITFSINKDFNEAVFQGEDKGDGTFCYRMAVYVLYDDRRVNPAYDSPWWPFFYEFKLDEKNALPGGKETAPAKTQAQEEPSKEELKAVYSLKRIEGGKEVRGSSFRVEKSLPYYLYSGKESKIQSYDLISKNTRFRLTNTGGEGWKLHIALYPCKLNVQKDGFYSIIPGENGYQDNWTHFCQSGRFVLDSLTGTDKDEHILWLDPGKSVEFGLKDYMEDVTSDPGDGTYIYFLYIHGRNAKYGADKCYTTATPILMLDEAGAAKVLSQQAASASFTDVAANSPFAESIQWAVAQGITNGKTATTFGPGDTCTVSHILTFLWRANGRPGAGDNERSAVTAWAKGLGIDTEHLSAPCTRSMAVSYLWKAAGSPGVSKPAAFTDVPAQAGYANAVAWAVENGVTSGKTAAAFAPDDVCTRGQIVTFLYRASR